MRVPNIKSIIIALVAMLTVTGCNGQDKQEVKQKDQSTMGKSIVIFFSHAGDNYAVGNIELGNTKIVADYISKIIGADLFEIITHKYDGMAYTPLTDLAKKEARNGELPEYEGDVDLSQYDTVFIGGPILVGHLSPSDVHLLQETCQRPEGKERHPLHHPRGLRLG